MASSTATVLSGDAALRRASIARRGRFFSGLSIAVLITTGAMQRLAAGH